MNVFKNIFQPCAVDKKFTCVYIRDSTRAIEKITKGIIQRKQSTHVTLRSLTSNNSFILIICYWRLLCSPLLLLWVISNVLASDLVIIILFHLFGNIYNHFLLTLVFLRLGSKRNSKYFTSLKSWPLYIVLFDFKSKRNIYKLRNALFQQSGKCELPLKDRSDLDIMR